MITVQAKQFLDQAKLSDMQKLTMKECIKCIEKTTKDDFNMCKKFVPDFI